MQLYTYFIVRVNRLTLWHNVLSYALPSSSRIPISVITNVVHGLLGHETLKMNTYCLIEQV